MLDQNLAVAAAPRVLFVSSEAFPLAKTGGLADVCGALPATLRHQGVDVRLMLPGYAQALDMTLEKRTVCDLAPATGIDGSRLVAGRMPGTELPVYLLECPPLFRRGGSLYQDPEGRDWPDNHGRFASFCRAAAAVALGEAGLGWRPDIVHANDWHTGLVPALISFGAAPRPKSVFTIHNMAFQGNFPIDTFPALKLPQQALTMDGVEFYGRVSFLKAGIRYGDRLTTVSPTYAREILTPEFGCGLDGLLRHRAADLVGILNGVDYGIWDPTHDSELAHRYSADDSAGKAACKSALRAEVGLPTDTGAPLMIYVNRLTHQKMADVVLQALPSLICDGAQIVVHGEGDRDFEQRFLASARQHPQQVAVKIGYREPLAHRMNAGADLSLTPSRFEPCGLTTMYAMRYGALPVTRPVGGLADTVKDASAYRTPEHEGTGFVFAEESADDLAGCVRRATAWYSAPEAWQALQSRAMKRDFGWERSAARYLEVYRGLLAGRDTLESRGDDAVEAAVA